MPYAFVQDVPIDAPTYDRIMEQLGPQLPQGLLVHLAFARQEGGLRYIDVWDSEADFERFAEERLHPVIHPMLRQVFGEADMPSEPDRDALDLIHVWQPSSATRPQENAGR